MPEHEVADDLATLWILKDGTRCLLASVAGGWQVRTERLGETLRSYVAANGSEAQAVAAGWLRECHTVGVSWTALTRKA